MNYEEIEKKTGLKYLGSIRLCAGWKKQPYESDKIVYICRRRNNYVLKVGQTCNWRSRFAPYRQKAGDYMEIDLFEAKSWAHQDQAEAALRRYCVKQGHTLPWDYTNRKGTRVKV